MVHEGQKGEDKAEWIIAQEGVNSEGSVFRQMMFAFQGNIGLAFLTISSPLDEWDRAEYDQMVESIR